MKNTQSYKRIQLTLFVDQSIAQSIEWVRKSFNPIQYALIKAHVTLCREDKWADIDKVLQNLTKYTHPSIRIAFGHTIGALLPASGPNAAFQQIRKQILTGLFETPRIHEPHITLMHHPRNFTCTDRRFDRIQKSNFPKEIELTKISLIELEKEWRVLKEFELNREMYQILFYQKENFTLVNK